MQLFSSIVAYSLYYYQSQHNKEKIVQRTDWKTTLFCLEHDIYSIICVLFIFDIRININRRMRRYILSTMDSFMNPLQEFIRRAVILRGDNIDQLDPRWPDCGSRATCGSSDQIMWLLKIFKITGSFRQFSANLQIYSSIIVIFYYFYKVYVYD